MTATTPPSPATPEATPVLELDQVGKVYAGNPPVEPVRGVTLTITRGELVAVLGPSGSGKTTLLHLMAALDRSTSGVVRVGLGHRLRHRPTALSGGERQRVAIARALVGRPQVVLADEPTGNLDSAATSELVALLQQLNRQGITLVVVTHDPLVAGAMSRQVQLRDGQVVADSGSKGGRP